VFKGYRRSYLEYYSKCSYQYVVDSAFVFACKALLLGIVYKQEHNTTRLFIVYYLTLWSCTDIIDDVSRIKAFKKLSLKVEVCEAVRSTRSTNNTCQ
jgi:hypothetical protein